MRSKDIRTLIVGAGISGLAAARALHAWGAEVEVVERTAGPAVAGAGIYLPGNTSRALHRLGLGSVLERRALRIAGQTFADHSGRVLARIDTAGVWGDVGDCLAMPRAALLELLLSGAADVPIRWGVEPRTVTVGDDGATVELSDGTHGRYDLVLGADGVHSAVRRLVFGDGGARPVGQYAYRFLLDRPGFAPEWSVRLGRGSSFLMIPVGGDQVYCYCDGPAEPIVPMHRLLSAYAEPVPTLLAALDQAGDTVRIHAGPIDEVVLDRWSRGRVLLIGDAAHTTSPNMAQGAAMALEDAVVLADSLAAADHLHDALHAYELRRRRRTEWVLHQTHRRDRTRNLPAIVRNAVLRRFGERIYHANYRPLLQAP